MKLAFSLLVTAITIAGALAQEGCFFTVPATPMEFDLTGTDGLMFQGLAATVVSRVVGDPMVRILRHTNAAPMIEMVDGIVMVSPSSCVDARVTSGSFAVHALASSVTVAAVSYLSGASPSLSAALGVVTSFMPVVQAQESCADLVEIEIRGPASIDDELINELENKIAELEEANASLQMMLNTSVSIEQSERLQFQLLADNFALNDLVNASVPADQTTRLLDNRGAAEVFDVAGFPIIQSVSPEAAFHLPNAGDDSLVRDMQGAVFQFPTSSNQPSDVVFPLPAPPAYSVPSDLYFKPITQIAALLRSGAVDCVTITQAFIDRLTEFDPYLGIVASENYVRALETAAAHDALLAAGTDLGPLMCIPFGVKDHHQIYDDDITTYGHILYSNHTQTVKSTLMQTLLGAGAIPIAKMLLGSFASGSGHGWGVCMSPYLNGNGGGSSCGPGSGAALGALPFAVSEETSGSIASPTYANLISGHIGSYGSISRAGAGLLCSETDHLGFHSRYLSDFGLIFNYMRTGADPLDGDALDIEMINPADVDVSQLRVLMIDGAGRWVYDEENDEWNWNDVIPNSRRKAAWNWVIRSQRIKDKLTAANVTFDTFTLDEAGALWSFDETTEYFDCAAPDVLSMSKYTTSFELSQSSLSNSQFPFFPHYRTAVAGGPWAKTQDFVYAFENSKFSQPTNIPKKDYRYMQYCMVQMGRRFLNDDVWATYDVIIDTHTSAGGGYPIPGNSFEQWVRTAKTFVIDYMEAMPCLHVSGAAIEGAPTTLTAKPFEDYKNFAIGALIQDPDNLLLPNDDAIKSVFEGRTRCINEFFDGMNDPLESCPALNTAGGPPSPFANGNDGNCVVGGSRQHLPDDFGLEPYVPPYLMDERAPDRALWRWDEYGPVACTTICPFLQSFCDLKGIVCDDDRLAEEAEIMAGLANGRGLKESRSRRLKPKDIADLEDEL